MLEETVSGDSGCSCLLESGAETMAEGCSKMLKTGDRGGYSYSYSLGCSCLAKSKRGGHYLSCFAEPAGGGPGWQILQVKA